MSTSDPLLPSSGDPEEMTVAAEPGSGGPQPQFSEESDLAVGDEPGRRLEDALGDGRPPFRTPTPGEGLAPADVESGAD